MTLEATLPVTSFAFIPSCDRALSEQALVLCDLINDASAFSGSVAIGEPRRMIQEALTAAYAAAQSDDWDNAGSRRVEPSTYRYAEHFLSLLPSGVSFPEITVDTDGEIFFEWARGPRQVFSVSVGRDGTLTYAGLFGHNKIHGTEYLREALPSVISDCLERLSARSGL
jgi:hypothetical protein